MKNVVGIQGIEPLFYKNIISLTLSLIIPLPINTMYLHTLTSQPLRLQASPSFVKNILYKDISLERIIYSLVYRFPF